MTDGRNLFSQPRKAETKKIENIINNYYRLRR